MTAEELISRLKAGKIYKKEKIQTALNNFFKTENILQLRELALKEVAFRVEKKVETEVVPEEKAIHRELYLACISSNEKHRDISYVVPRGLRPDIIQIL